MKLIIFQEKIPHYRIDLFNEISSRPEIDLTLIYTQGLVNLDVINFNLIKIPVYRIGVFRYPVGLFKELKEGDQVVLMFDLKWLIIYRCLGSKIRNKITLWGIGISSQKGLKEKKYIDKFRFWIVSKFKGVILYSNFVANYYLKSGIGNKKINIANNTIRIENKINLNNRFPKNLLFVGTINKRKKLDRLINAFSNISDQIDIDVCLNIIGDGILKNDYEKLVNNLGLGRRIKFHGKIESHEELQYFFNSSIISISLGQAGLSILHSFAYGVPFLCYKNAINGGELENVIHNKTGILTSEDNLEKDLIEIINSKELMVEMSNNCFNHYWKLRTVEKFTIDFLKGLD